MAVQTVPMPVPTPNTVVMPTPGPTGPRAPVVDTVRAKEGGIQLGGTVVTSMRVNHGGIEAIVEDVFGVMVTFKSVRADKLGGGGKIRIPWSNIACVVYAAEEK